MNNTMLSRSLRYIDRVNITNLHADVFDVSKDDKNKRTRSFNRSSQPLPLERHRNTPPHLPSPCLHLVTSPHLLNPPALADIHRRCRAYGIYPPWSSAASSFSEDGWAKKSTFSKTSYSAPPQGWCRPDGLHHVPVGAIERRDGRISIGVAGVCGAQRRR